MSADESSPPALGECDGDRMGASPLCPRLAMIADELEERASRGRLALATVYDIGADHAMLLVWLLRHGICSEAVATDINSGPLIKAAGNIERAGLGGAIRLVRCDGLQGLGGLGPDTAVVAAGMGGTTLAGILERGQANARRAGIIALQPMNNHGTLRRALAELGYAVERERLAVDGGRVYVAIFCRWSGEPQSHTPAEYAIGKGEPYGTRDACMRYLKFARKIASNRHGGLLALAREGGLAAAESSELAELEHVLRHIDARMARMGVHG